MYSGKNAGYANARNGGINQSSGLINFFRNTCFPHIKRPYSASKATYYGTDTRRILSIMAL